MLASELDLHPLFDFHYPG